MNNKTDQEQIDQPSPEVKTPFRVVDDGWSFVCEIVNRTTLDDDEDPVFHFTSRLYGWELVTGVGPICEPRPYQYDRVSGPITELTYQGACSEYVRGDAEPIAKAWLQYRKRKRNPVLCYLSTLLNHFYAMTNTQKPPTYLSQVADNKLFAFVLIVVSLGLIYTGSLMLFADWDSYEDPFSAQGSNRFIFIACAVIMTVCLLVPLFKKSYRDARNPASSAADASGFIPGQDIVVRADQSAGYPVPATYVGPSQRVSGYLVVRLSGSDSEQHVPASVVFLQ